ncbi:MAG: hypothetical protein KAR21_10735 [Spirochaetales bacterium]|nr:hypothetical protein [Spirochaetales bacterium]
MVVWEDMTESERDRFIYLTLSEDALKAIVVIMQKKHGSGVSTEEIMKFAFKVARNRMIPKKMSEVRDSQHRTKMVNDN